VSKTLKIFMFSVGIMFVYAFVYRYANVGMSRSMSLGSTILGYLTLFLNDSVMLLILYIICVQKWELVGPKLKGLTVAVVLLLVAFNLAGGSRSGLVRPVLYLFFTLFALRGDFRVTKKLAMTVVSAIVISFCVFPFVTYLKHKWFSGEDVSNISAYTDLLQTGGDSIRYDTAAFLYPAVNRLKGLASISAVLTIPDDYFREYLTVTGQLKYMINKLLPLVNPFPDVINTSRLYNAVIFNYTLTHVYENYTTSAYTIWGISYVHFGWWGGLAFVFVITFVISAIYQRAAGTRSIYNLFLRTWLIVITYGVLRGFGFDDLITTYYMFLATGIGYFVIMHLWRRNSYVWTYQGGKRADRQMGGHYSLDSGQ